MPSLSLNDETSQAGAYRQDVVQNRQFLTFLLGEQLFAMAIENIREIIEFCNLTEVPLMPNFLRGVINLRGAVVPIIDLSVRLGRVPASITKRTCIVILELVQQDQTLLLGVMVDTVRTVLSVEENSIEPPLTFGANLRTDFIEGMINIKDKFVVALDVGAVFSVEELTSLIGLADQEFDVQP